MSQSLVIIGIIVIVAIVGYLVYAYMNKKAPF